VVLASFDLTTSNKNDLVTLLKSWTHARPPEIAAGQSVTVPIYDPSTGVGDGRLRGRHGRIDHGRLA
jgi:hypothetical protein